MKTNVADTSLAAYEAITAEGVTSEQQRKILRAVRLHPEGLTRRELAREIGMETSTVAGRVNDLINLGVLRDKEETRRCSRSGRVVKVVEIATREAQGRLF